ncbi:MAG: segregation/condensation protein A [Eggerthellaceae bacterium]|nr:segregation/condensation protein A [Eggerthellaceae bacterium]
MAYKVRIDSFEGPFDLLLYLVSRQKVDIGAISITEIADQYLEEVSRMDALDLDVASDFLLVASTLLEIKAESLIPRERTSLDEELAELAPSEARDMLVARLVEYKKFKNASAALHARFLAEGRMRTRPFGPDASLMGLMPDFLSGVTVDSLALLAARAMARREVFLLESEHIAAKPIPVEVHVRAIHGRISNRKHLRFSDLVNDSTPSEIVVVTFLAILELYKRQMVRLEQPEAFGDISIDYIEGSGELTLVGEDALTSVADASVADVAEGESGASGDLVDADDAAEGNDVSEDAER